MAISNTIAGTGTYIIPGKYDTVYQGAQRLDVMHCTDGTFIHAKDIKDLSTKVFNTEDGMALKLSSEVDEDGGSLFLRLHDNSMKVVILKDEINRERMGMTTYDVQKKMLSCILDTWIFWKYTIAEENGGV